MSSWGVGQPAHRACAECARLWLLSGLAMCRREYSCGLLTRLAFTSDVVAVGHPAHRACAMSARSWPLRRLAMRWREYACGSRDCVMFRSDDFGVGHGTGGEPRPEQAFADVVRARAVCSEYDRPDGVVFSFHV